ncbi:MAG TPA: hypothetical protein VFT65_12425 [Candidatus Angelobacter sp.]|nr:hypothetical protein [Candidatus Angelobacter sp.]
MKVTPDRIKARSEQLRTHGFKIRGSMVRAMLEMNAGARTPSNIKSEHTPADRTNQEKLKLEKAS